MRPTVLHIDKNIVTFIASIEKGKANNKTILAYRQALRSRIFPILLTDLPSVLYVGRLVSPKVRNQFEKKSVGKSFLGISYAFCKFL